MTGKSRRKKKQTIFWIFLWPLIAIMLVQGIVTMGTLTVKRVASMLEEYSSGMLNQLVENRKVILQNDMNERWSSVSGQEELMNQVVEQFLKDRRVSLDQLLVSDELKDELLTMLFPECVDLVRSNPTTGIFLILAGSDIMAEGNYDGFYIRDSDPDTSPLNYTDLLLERGNKQLSREWNIPLDTEWTTHFRMDGQGRNAADNFFYEPWRAGVEHADADTVDLGYWSMPFFLEKEHADSYEMITYS